MSIKDLEDSQQPLEVQQLKAQFMLVAQKLVDGTPGIVEAMIDIHKNTQLHEELVELFDDEDLAILHKAHEKHKQFVLVQQVAKQTTTRKTKLSSNDLANL